MDLNLVLVVVVIAIALLFDYTNGFHDAANAIATSVSTRALTPRVALAMAAVMNVVGALLGTEVAKTIGEGIIDIYQYSNSTDVSIQRMGLIIVLAALVGAVTWNYITWWFGMPSSSSHALIGGLVGAGLASATQVQWTGILDHVVIPMVVSPVIGFVAAFLIMKGIMRWLANRPFQRTMRRFRYAQTVSAAAMALGHGLQDAQKTMGVIVMALLAGGYGETHNIFDPVTGDMQIPLWVKLSAAAAISLGTYSGGWRIMRTLGRRIIDLDPARGFVAEGVSAAVLYIAAFGAHAPISTTQTITSAILGAGATKRWSAVRWNVAGNIVVAWFLTLPAAALVAGIMFFLFHTVIPG
ncbi:inorganic phosphate transporter [Scrofimicrobium sp. R131]|uniref:Inorganic phosphate transporter n=1 Tax=Scrofimicrobium appendicitidis TaxID=3079930 RepID=A0AAU7V7G1_9ACTO